MSIKEPPGYPYPGDNLIYCSLDDHNAYDRFTVGEDSWIAVARLEETAVHTFNEREHRNPYRLTIHTPVRGSVSYLVKEQDATLYITAMLAMLTDSETMGGFDRGEYEVNLDWYNRKLPDGYEVREVES